MRSWMRTESSPLIWLRGLGRTKKRQIPVPPTTCSPFSVGQQEISELRGSQEQMRQANIVLARELAEAREQALREALTQIKEGGAG